MLGAGKRIWKVEKEKMKKKLILGVAAMVCGIALAEDSYLYWQINQNEAEKPIEFAYAQVKATKDGSTVYVGDELLGVQGFAEGRTAISAGPIRRHRTVHLEPDGAEGRVGVDGDGVHGAGADERAVAADGARGAGAAEAEECLNTETQRHRGLASRSA